jgi:hypothetical protein
MTAELEDPRRARMLEAGEGLIFELEELTQLWMCVCV